MKCFWAFSTFAIGGPQRRFANIVEQLGSDWHHVVTAMDNNYDAELLLGENVSYTRCPLPIEKTRSLSRANMRNFSDALEETKPDLLLTSNWGTIEWRLANRKTHVPHIHFEDGFGPDEAADARNWKRNLTRRWLFSRRATGHNRFAFVAPSKTLGEIFENDWRIPPSRLFVIPNGVDARRFAAIEPPGDRLVPTIGAIGALRPEKRFDRLLRVFAELRKTHRAALLIVGDGPQEEELKSLASDLGIEKEVLFTGAVADVAQTLKLMDIYAITSDTEQMPISLIEAMAAGLPVAGSDVGDIGDMLSCEGGQFLNRPDDEEALVRALGQLLDDHELRAHLGAANAAKAAAAYSSDKMVNSYRVLFEAIANGAVAGQRPYDAQEAS